MLLSGGLSQSSLSLFQRRQTRGLHLHLLFSLFTCSLLSSSPLLLHSCLLSFATPSNKFRHIDSAALFSLSTSAAATDRTESERREQGRSMSRVERERRRPPRPPSQPLALSLSQPAFLSFSSSGGSWRRREIKTQRRRRPTKALWTG